MLQYEEYDKKRRVEAARGYCFISPYFNNRNAMIKNKLLTALVMIGLISLNVEPYIAAAQTPGGTSTSGVSVLMNENFESTSDNGSIPSGWTKTGDWGVADASGDFGHVLYGDFPNIPYAGDKTGTVQTPTFDMTGATSATVDLLTRCDTEYTPNTDFMTLQASGDNGTSWSDLMTWNEPTIDTDTDPSGTAVKNLSGIAIPSNLLTSTFKLGFKWQTNGTDNDHDGCFIDNVTLTKNGTGSTGSTGGTGGTGTTTPGTGTTTPSTGTTTPSTGDTGTTTPSTGTTTPSTGDTGTTTPSTGTTTPSTGTTTPSTGGTGTTTPGTGETGGTATTTTSQSISACALLSGDGTTYTLSQNITSANTCFIIDANNVTLDGNGHTITGGDTAGQFAVTAQNKSGITVKNLGATHYEQAFSFSAVNNSTFDADTLNNNSYGFVLHGGSGNTIKNTTANNNLNVGIYVQNAGNTTIDRNTANSNAVGINLDASNLNIVTNNTANSNDRGILLLTSNDNAVSGNTANQNAFGIALETGSTHNTVTNNTQNGNGVGLAVGSGSNTFTGLHIDSSTSKAIRFYESDSSGNVVNDTVLSNTGSLGYDVSFDPSGANFGAAAVNGTVFNNTPIARFTISKPGTFTVKNAFGSAQLLQDTNGSGENFSNDLKIESGKITVATSSIFDSHQIRLTLNNTIATSSQIQRNGVACSNCNDFTSTSDGSNSISFTIFNAGVYTTTGSTTAPAGGTGTTTLGNGTTTPGTGDTGTTTPSTGTTTPSTGTTTPSTGNTGTTTDSTATTTQDVTTATPTPTPAPVVTSSGGGGGGGYLPAIVLSSGTNTGSSQSTNLDSALQSLANSLGAGTGVTPVTTTVVTTTAVKNNGSLGASNFPSQIAESSPSISPSPELTGIGGPDASAFGTDNSGDLTAAAASSTPANGFFGTKAGAITVGVIILLIIGGIIYGASRT